MGFKIYLDHSVLNPYTLSIFPQTVCVASFAKYYISLSRDKKCLFCDTFRHRQTLVHYFFT